MATSIIKKPYPLAVTTVSGTTTASGSLNAPINGIFVHGRTTTGGQIVLKRSDGYVTVYTPANEGPRPLANTSVTVEIYYIPN